MEGDGGQLVKVDAVEGEVFVVDGITCFAQNPGLHLVLLVWQQLEFYVRITRS